MFKKTAAPASAAAGYTISKSLRFRSSASAYLNRTPASTTNTKTWTLSFWIKRGALSVGNKPFAWGVSGTENGIQFRSDDGIEFYQYASGGYVWVLDTTQVFRDPSAWYHFVFAVDTTQSTSTNRLKMYVNGTQITAFSTSTYPSLNVDTFVNSTSYAGMIGNLTGQSQYFDGEMAEVNFIDGQALTPSSFGSTNSTTGVWQPVAYTGTYGTNGYYLPFTDVATTSGSNAGLGKDFSGNANYWTTNNISVTAGSTYDSMTDVPTLTSATTANYCVVNPLDTGGSTLTNGNLTQTTPSSGYGAMRSTLAVSSGKWYWEVTPTSLTGGAQLGICGVSESISSSTQLYNLATAYTYFSNANKGNNGSVVSYGASYVANDVIGVALDLDVGTITFYKNNSSQGTAYTGLSGTFTPAICDNSGSSSSAFNVNFGQQPFTYTPPTGYVALNTYNLPTSTIVAGNKYMDATTFTANGSTNAIVNAGGFQPDFAWTKSRNYAYSHELYDSVRGVTKVLDSNATVAESTDANGLLSFNSNGFTLGYNNGANYNNGASGVTWQWQAGQGTTSSNTNGSITSNVSVSTTAGFSILTYTGTGSVGTIGHGLGIAPSFIIVRQRNAVNDWNCYHTSIGNTAAIFLESTSAPQTNVLWWNNTSPTSSVFTIGSGSGNNTNGGSYLAYCWSQVAGFSAFGSYTGNGSTDGPFVYTGFRPKWIMLKLSSSSGEAWLMYDTSRNTYNVMGSTLRANDNSTEDTNIAYYLDGVSNGFKLRASASNINTNGATYIYAAFAENPFKNALAR